MPQNTITLRDFSGGLNTAVDSSQIPLNMTASMQNVDITDSRAITRRNGYVPITATYIANKPIESLYRYYKVSDDKYWVTVCGTVAFVQQYVSTEVPLTRLEAENATITGSYTSYTSAAFSAGKGVVLLSATNDVAVSYSTAIKLGFGNSVTASVSVDGGAMQDVTAKTSYSFSGLSATSHTVSIVHNPIPIKQETDSGTATLTSEAIGADGIIQVRQTFTATAMQLTAIEYVVDSAPSKNAPMSMTVRRADESIVADVVPSPTTVGINKVMTPTIPNLTPGDVYTIELELTAIGEPSFTFGLAYGANNPYGGGAASQVYGTGLAANCDLVFKVYGGVTLDYIDYSALSSWTKRDVTLSATTDTWGITTLDDACYYNSPYDNLRKTTGGDSAVVYANGVSGTLAPAGGYLTEFKRRLFTAGRADEPALLEYTETGEPENWTGGGSIRLAGKDSGGKCTGLKMFSNALFYFSYDKMFGLDVTGPDTNWVAKTISNSIGCIAPKTLAEHGNSLVFLAADGVRGYGYIPGVNSPDGSAFMLLSENIAPTLRALVHPGKACAAIYNDHYWLSVDLDNNGVNDAILVYRFPRDDVPGSWVKYTGMNIGCFAVTRGGDGEYGLYGGDAITGHIYKMDTGNNDNGSAISMSYRVPPIRGKDGYHTIKHYRRVELAAEATAVQSVTLTPITDDVDYPAATVTLDSSTDTRPVRVPLSSRGRSFGLDISSDGAGQPLTIHEITLVHTGARMR